MAAGRVGPWNGRNGSSSAPTRSRSTACSSGWCGPSAGRSTSSAGPCATTPRDGPGWSASTTRPMTPWWCPGSRRSPPRPGAAGPRSGAWPSCTGPARCRSARSRSWWRSRPPTGPSRSRPPEWCIDTLKETVPIWKRGALGGRRRLGRRRARAARGRGRGRAGEVTSTVPVRLTSAPVRRRRRHARLRRPPGRPVRPGAPRPAHLGHRPLQPPLRLLHARGGRGVRSRGPDPHLRGAGPGRPGGARPRGEPGPHHRRRAAGAPRPRDLRRAAGRHRVRRPLDDDQRDRHSSAAPRGLADAGLRRVNISCDSLRPRPLRARSGGAATSAPCCAAMDAAEASRARSGQGERGRAGRGERRRDRRLRRASPATPAASCASSSTCRSTARAVGPRRASCRRPGSCETIGERWPLEAVRPSDADPNAPATRYRFTDGVGEIGVIPTVTEPFCGTCDRLRVTADGADPQLPVRRRGDAAARPSCATGADRRGDRARAPAGRWAASCRGTGSTTPGSCGRPARCR